MLGISLLNLKKRKGVDIMKFKTFILKVLKDIIIILLLSTLLALEIKIDTQ